MISVKEFLGVVSTAGALGFMAVALWAAFAMIPVPVPVAVGRSFAAVLG